MKLLLTFVLLTLTLSANYVSWYGDYELAHKEALEQNKLLMVLLIEKDSKECSEVLKTVFLNQPYIDEINEKYIAVLVTKNQKSSYPIEMLYTFTYPSLFFLDKHELFMDKPIRGDILVDKLEKMFY